MEYFLLYKVRLKSGTDVTYAVRPPSDLIHDFMSILMKIRLHFKPLQYWEIHAFGVKHPEWDPDSLYLKTGILTENEMDVFWACFPENTQDDPIIGILNIDLLKVKNMVKILNAPIEG